MLYNRAMPTFHRADSDVRKHLILQRESAQSLNPKVLYAGELNDAQHWKEEPHTHPFCEIIYISQGNCIIECNGQEYSARKGDIVLYNAGTLHCERACTDESLSFLFFAVTNLKFSHAERDMPLDHGASPVLTPNAYAQDFQFLFHALLREARERRRYGNEACKSLSNAILCLVLRLLSGKEEKYLSPNETYLRSREYIDMYYRTIQKVDDVCKAMYVSRYYLTHLFKEYAGISPLHYILDKRIEDAKKMLKDTDLSVEEIAFSIGYAEPNSFINYFKKRENKTPASYRKQERDRPTNPK